ncbi:TPA: hypothetical protein NOE94_005898 [Pseudomonas aeruginosa]|nr:hypothetical protein [Pseudomonas aeruginosa]
MSIDWSKAPEGATHWEPTGPEFHEGWMKEEGEKWFWWSEVTKEWVETFSVPVKRKATFEARPQETWDGQGLPPAGLLVEWKAGSDHEWRRVTVLAYANGDAWLQPEDGDSFIVGNPANFRRIRTPEQIAAEEREKAVGDMAMSIQGVPYQYPTLYALFDAGYRRQEEGK